MEEGTAELMMGGKLNNSPEKGWELRKSFFKQLETAGAKALWQDSAQNIPGIIETSVARRGFTLSKMWTFICIGWPITGTASQLPKPSLK